MPATPPPAAAAVSALGVLQLMPRMSTQLLPLPLLLLLLLLACRVQEGMQQVQQAKAEAEGLGKHVQDPCMPTAATTCSHAWHTRRQDPPFKRW